MELKFWDLKFFDVKRVMYQGKVGTKTDLVFVDIIKGALNWPLSII